VCTVIIFLNAENFIDEAIASVFAQTYDDWELVLVDDGSSDASTAIAKDYAARFPARIRYLEHEGHQNRGKSASRNLAIRNSRSEFVAFLDADDVWMRDKLREQVEILDAHATAGMVYGPGEWWYSWSGKEIDQNRDSIQKLWTEPNILV